MLLLAAGLLVRLVMIAAGADRSLWTRVEVSTPANGLLPAKEALSLLRLGVSPYRSSACHVPPLLLSAMRLLGQQHLALQLAADLAAAWMLRDVARLASRPGGAMGPGEGGATRSGHAAGHGNSLSPALLPPPLTCKPSSPTSLPFPGRGAIQPDTVMGIYLLNPFGIASCIAGTRTPLENACVVGALLAALRGSAIGTSVALACAAYIGLHPLLLGVSAGSKQARERKSCFTGRTAHPQPLSVSLSPAFSRAPQVPLALILSAGSQSGGGKAAPTSLAGPSLRLLLGTAWAVLSLVALSDGWLAAAAALPGEQCLPLLAGRVASALGIPLAFPTAGGGGGGPGGPLAGGAASLTGPSPAGAGRSGAAPSTCWATHVYGLPLLFGDLTPNLGQWWYFFAQVFPAQRAFFCYVAHSLCAVFSVPLALRFPSRGLLLAVVQLSASTMLRPYPSVGDWALFLSVLPLLPRELAGITRGLFFTNTFVLLAVLAPAMWTQWIDTESANSNFFYSITLLLGAWTTVLLTQLLLGAVQAEEEEGKEEQRQAQQGDPPAAQPVALATGGPAGEG
jgi:hypothetical protein